MTREEKMETAIKKIIHNHVYASDCEWTGLLREEVHQKIIAVCLDALKDGEGEVVWGYPTFLIEDVALLQMAKEAENEAETDFHV